MKKILYILILITTTCFAQAETTPINNAASDSATYYEQLYQYNLDSYNFDKKAANIAWITAWVSTGLAGVSTIAMFFYALEQFSNNNDQKISTSHPWFITTMIINGIGATSFLLYGGFEIAAAVRKSNYTEYDIQRKKNATTPSISVHITPIIDPINQSYGGALTLNF
ncbi:MAG: hypothetical protein IIT53_00240 [Fibrobacter sp.]|nr:hypothetical protein [Fibrobacter sp.]